MIVAVIVVVMMMVMIMPARIGQLPEFLVDDLALLHGDHEEGPGLTEMPGDSHAVVGGNSDFDGHL